MMLLRVAMVNTKKRVDAQQKFTRSCFPESILRDQVSTCSTLLYRVIKFLLVPTFYIE